MPVFYITTLLSESDSVLVITYRANIHFAVAQQLVSYYVSTPAL